MKEITIKKLKKFFTTHNIQLIINLYTYVYFYFMHQKIDEQT
jgi:hypothetical protein